MVLTEVFVLAVLLNIAIRLTLATRQIRHVAKHRAQVPAEFSQQLTLAEHQKAADYSIARTRLGMINLWVEIALLLGLTLFGGLNLLNNWAQSVLPGLWAGVLLFAAYGLIGSVIDLPLSYYRQFVLETRFGFNRMTPGLFFADWAKGLVLGAALGGPLLLAVLALMQAAGDHWWLWAWALWFGFSLLMMWVFPTFIAPLFNKFTPMPENATRERIVSLLKRCGFDSDGLFVMDGSKRSSHGNAYFSGMGKAKRIVFFDTLLNRLDDNQIEAVLAHELGHFRKNHVTKHLAFSGVASLVLFALLGQLIHAAWFYTELGVSPNLQGNNQAVALLLFALVLPYFTFPFRPLMSWLSRKHEFEADAFAAGHSKPEYLITALVKLYRDNASTLTPDPVHSAFYDSHPPASIRIAHLKQLQGAH